ncbi:hypothetical protein R7P64_24330, partial [Vibrio sp. 2304]|uniref:DUF7743 domain-containing protein n=1 Tax=Vibrio sp. 2304 TaxID=3074601 RepID=UPI0029647EA6
GNFRWYEPDEDYSFTVINNGEVDTTPPQLISVEFDKIEVEAGDTITVTAKGTDDISGVSSIYVYFEGNTGQQLPGISLYKTDKADTYKGIVRIGKYEEPGIRKLTRIEMQDNAGNRKSYTPEEDYSFTVINNGEVDVTPPKLISLEIDKTEVEAGDIITITAKVTDDLSGVSSVEVFFVSEFKRSSSMISLYKTNVGDTYKGILTIGKY